jgi:hypothetical protein
VTFFLMLLNQLLLDLFLSIFSTFDMEVENMDVKKTFLLRDIEEEIYMKHLEVFAMKRMKEPICNLKKSLYGFKKNPRMWYQKFDTYILGLGFSRSKAYHCVYSKIVGDHFIYVVLYVDDNTPNPLSTFLRDGVLKLHFSSIISKPLLESTIIFCSSRDFQRLSPCSKLSSGSKVTSSQRFEL